MHLLCIYVSSFRVIHLISIVISTTIWGNLLIIFYKGTNFKKIHTIFNCFFIKWKLNFNICNFCHKKNPQNNNASLPRELWWSARTIPGKVSDMFLQLWACTQPIGRGNIEISVEAELREWRFKMHHSMLHLRHWSDTMVGDDRLVWCLIHRHQPPLLWIRRKKMVWNLKDLLLILLYMS